MFGGDENESRTSRFRRSRRWSGVIIAACGLLLMLSAIVPLPPAVLFVAGLWACAGGVVMWTDGGRCR